MRTPRDQQFTRDPDTATCAVRSGTFPSGGLFHVRHLHAVPPQQALIGLPQTAVSGLPSPRPGGRSSTLHGGIGEGKGQETRRPRSEGKETPFEVSRTLTGGAPDSSISRACDSSSQGREFEPRIGCRDDSPLSDCFGGFCE